MFALYPRHRPPHSFYLLFYVIFAAACAVAGISTNRTIDDDFGDLITGFIPVYAPADEWNQGTQDNTCCLVRPDDLSQVHNGTWHDSTYHPGDPRAIPTTITLRFTGTAVYVFNILANHVADDGDVLTNMTFTLDGAMAGTFLHVPTASDAFIYNSPVFSKTSLDNVEHVLVIQSAVGTEPSLILFDYAVYTFETADPPTTTALAPGTVSTKTVTSVSTEKPSSVKSPPSSTSSDPATVSSPVSISMLNQTSSSTSSQATEASLITLPAPATTSSSSSSSTATQLSGTSLSGGQDSQATGRSSSHTVPIVAGVVGGVVGLLLLALISVALRKRAQRARPHAPLSDDPAAAFQDSKASRSMMEAALSAGAGTPGAVRASTGTLSDARRPASHLVGDRAISHSHAGSVHSLLDPFRPGAGDTPTLSRGGTPVSAPGLSNAASSDGGGYAPSEGESARCALLHASAPSSTGASVATLQPEVAGKMPAAGSETVLRSHIAVLEKEVARLREEGDRRERGEDGSEAPPPLYREVVGAA